MRSLGRWLIQASYTLPPSLDFHHGVDCRLSDRSLRYLLVGYFAPIGVFASLSSCEDYRFLYFPKNHSVGKRKPYDMHFKVSAVSLTGTIHTHFLTQFLWVLLVIIQIVLQSRHLSTT